MKHPKHWYFVKKIARSLGHDLHKQDDSNFFPSSFSGKIDPVLSFCITHKNRFEHLKKTLPVNLKDNQLQKGTVEFVLADFQDTNEVAEWVATELLEHIKCGYLKYFHAPLPKWSSPLAKNTAHWLASGEIVTNLDCDNYTGVEGGKFVIDQYLKEPNELMVWQYSRVRRDGSFGRISIRRELFEKLGGYDEQLAEMGFQDNDLMNRAMAFGIKRIEINDRQYNRAIKHAKYKPVGVSFKDLNRENAALSKRNVAEGKLFANEGYYGIRKNVRFMNEEGVLKDFIQES